MSRRQGFAIWLTGIPASGKSTLARALADRLERAGLSVVTLESDVLRKVLMPEAGYDRMDRDRFYAALAGLGAVLTSQGIDVIFDATASRRVYRDAARAAISRFLEIHVQCALDECRRRDPKGIYQRAASGGTAFVPGVQVPYEAPLQPDLVVDGSAPPERNAGLLIAELQRRGYLESV